SVRACRRDSSSLDEWNQIFFWRFGDYAEEKKALVEWVYAGALDPESITVGMAGGEAVFHAAAVVSFWPVLRQQMYEVNVAGTANVVNAALLKQVPWMIHTSSIAAIGRGEKNEGIDEETEWKDSSENTHYAISKHLAE